MKKALWWFAILPLLVAPAAAQIKTSPRASSSSEEGKRYLRARLTADAPWI